MSRNRLAQLIDKMTSLDSSVIAFSGGVDSTLLVKVAHMSGIRFLAITSVSETLPVHDRERAKSIAETLGIPHRSVKTGELSNESFTNNPPDRCFHCKDMLFSHLQTIAKKEHYLYILDGSNADDKSDYRPGLRANKKHGVLSPLMDLSFGKNEIRELSRELGLPTWDLPASPCLSSRVPYGVEITPGALKMISQAEDFLKSLGFRIVRVRTRNASATIEVGQDEVNRLFSKELRRTVLERFRQLGYKTVAIDWEGYQTGKLNRVLDLER